MLLYNFSIGALIFCITAYFTQYIWRHAVLDELDPIIEQTNQILANMKKEQEYLKNKYGF